MNISKSPGGYSQVISFPPDAHGSIFVLTEAYKDVSSNVTSVLDGAWKMTLTTSYSKDGKADVTNKPLQYKVYQSGHFIFGSTQTDPTTKNTVANIGYGTYTVGGAGEITETPINSSYKDIINVPIKLKLTFKGKDHYQQTILWTDGSKLVEEYERLK